MLEFFDQTNSDLKNFPRNSFDNYDKLWWISQYKSLSKVTTYSWSFL